MNSDLSWSEHYSFIISKAYRELSVLCQSFKPLNFSSTKKTLYTTMVCSHLIYCSPVWHPRFIKDIQLLERVQRRATKHILDDFTSDYKDKLISLELLPLMMFYELLDIMFFVKPLKTRMTVLIYLIIYSLQLATLSLLIFDLFILYRSSNNSSRHFYFNHIPRLWNVLPPITLDLPIYLFKSQLKSFL